METGHMPRFKACGERRAHAAHVFAGDAAELRCPGIQSVSEQSRAMDELVRRYAREHRLAMALREEAP
jgi:hypothetical protein